jgi:HlyD family secretion protein
MLKRLITILVLLGGLAGAAYAFILWQRSLSPEERPVRTSAVTNCPITELLEESGTIQPRNEVIIKSEVNGRVDAIYVEDGDLVTNGQLLVDLDKTDLLNRRRELELDLEEAMLMQEQAQLDFNRNRDLYLQELVASEVYDKNRIELSLKQNRMRKIKSQIATVDDNLLKSRIVSPAEGTVVNRSIEFGEVVIGASSVSSGTELMKVADLALLEVESQINEVDISSLTTGMPVKVAVDSMPGHIFTGVVETLAPVAQDSGNGIRTFELVAVLSEGVSGLRPGMTANLTFTLGVATQALAVPLASVFCDNYEAALSDQEFYLFIETPTGFVKRTVKVGINDYERIQIVSGLTAQATAAVALERPPQDALISAAEKKRTDPSRAQN